MSTSGTQGVRLRKPQPASTSSTTPTIRPQNEALLKDGVRKTARRPWAPSFSVAFRMLILIRTCAAMYSNIQDCDEVFNFWEPLHYITHGSGFQTWEVTPQFAIRSWAYIFLHSPFTMFGKLFSTSKRPSFFAMRLTLGLICSLCEARFYRSVVEHVNARVGRYMLFMLSFSPGMWNASTAFLPSTFAMYFNMLAMSFALRPSTKRADDRVLFATICFAVGAIFGWPFSIVVSFPFVFEELFVLSGDKISSALMGKWIGARWVRMLGCVTLAALLLIPVFTIDSLAYGRLALVPWGIVSYNVLGGEERGPDLYGTEPWSYYFLNLALNFNLVALLALASLPALLVTRAIDYKRLGIIKHGADESSPYTILTLRLAPVYVWIGLLTAQSHKEERFMYPIYPLLCFNAAVTVYLFRGWLETIYIKATASPYKASKTSAFRLTTLNIILIFSILSLSRICALHKYYHAPLDIAFHMEYVELPRLLNVTGLLPSADPPLPSKDNYTSTFQRLRNQPHKSSYDDEYPAVDFTPLKGVLGGVRLCLGKEWYRFPSHFLVPEGVEVRWIKSEFNGQLPGKFASSSGRGWPWGLWPWDGMRVQPEGANDLNKEDPAVYVEPSTCDYLIDSDFPSHPSSSPLEPRYIKDEETWEVVYCLPFLDASHSPLITRVLWLPGEKWARSNSWGDYCLIKERARATEREGKVWMKAV